MSVELRQAVTAARAQLLAAAADPGVPAVVRMSRSDAMRSTNARMTQLLKQPCDRDDRIWDLARLLFTCAVDAYWYRFSAYASVERRAWDVLSTLPAGTTVARDELRWLREAIDDAKVVTRFAPVSAAPAEDSQTWPVIDQAELQWRMRTDGINIRLGITLGAGKTAPAPFAGPRVSNSSVRAGG